MPRKRNQLIAAFPPGTLDSAAASEALRKAEGDLEKARLAIMAEHAAASSGAKKDDRVAPRYSVPIHNLSDRKYCCVWSVEPYEDGYRPDVARTLLATVARHVNPILRDRGWRVKRLLESESKKWIGLCTGNGRADADAASVNIQLNLRTEPSRHCRQFRPFRSILSVMLHEITHTSIGLEDIHPPAFYELLDEIKAQYREKLAAGEVDAEKDEYGTTEQGTFVSGDGTVGSAATSASDVLGAGGADGLDVLGSAGTENECGASTKKRRGRGKRRGGGGRGYSKGFTSNVPTNEKKRPLLKGAKMVDKRTKVGKATMRERENVTPRELAARAALARLGGGGGGGGAGAGASAVSAVAAAARGMIVLPTSLNLKVLLRESLEMRSASMTPLRTKKVAAVRLKLLVPGRMIRNTMFRKEVETTMMTTQRRTMASLITSKAVAAVAAIGATCFSFPRTRREMAMNEMARKSMMLEL